MPDIKMEDKTVTAVQTDKRNWLTVDEDRWVVTLRLHAVIYAILAALAGGGVGAIAAAIT